MLKWASQVIPDDRLFKIRPVINLVIPRFLAVYGLSKQLSQDEMTIAFKGKLTIKMYNPNKPDKFGYKVFDLSEPSQALCYSGPCTLDKVGLMPMLNSVPHTSLSIS